MGLPQMVVDPPDPELKRQLDRALLNLEQARRQAGQGN
jgi:hypothetical protein